MKIEFVKLGELQPYKNNPKLHPLSQVERIANSIGEFGFLVPVLVDSDRNIIAGHGRVLAAEKLGLEQIPVIRVEHLSEEQMRAYRIADNKLTESGWDLGLLESELDSLRDIGFDVDLTGFEDIELGELFLNVDSETPPAEFKEFDDTIKTDNICPKCGYEW